MKLSSVSNRLWAYLCLEVSDPHERLKVAAQGAQRNLSLGSGLPIPRTKTQHKDPYRQA